MRKTALFLASCLVLVGCQESAPAPEPPGERVENASIGLVITELPSSLRVAANEDGVLALETLGVPVPPAEEGGESGRTAETGTPDGGRIDFVLGEPEMSINLVAAAAAHEESLTARPEGALKRRTEMMSANFGTVYLSGGRYVGENGGEEETVLMMIHPWGDRMLTVRYVYPEGTTEEIGARVNGHLLALMEFLEGMPVPSEPPAAEPATEEQAAEEGG